MEKPVIDSKRIKGKLRYTYNGLPIADFSAREHWDAGNCNWSDTAYIRMSHTVLEISEGRIASEQ
jgi:hypothetical protein